jgi:hypothetical protein
MSETVMKDEDFINTESGGDSKGRYKFYPATRKMTNGSPSHKGKRLRGIISGARR